MTKKIVLHLLVAVFLLPLFSIVPNTANAYLVELPGSNPFFYNSFPFSNLFGSGRYQQVYDSSLFGEKVFIESILFIPEYTGTYGANIEISIGYTSVLAGFLSTDLDSNMTGESQVVFSDPNFSQEVTAGWYHLVFDFSSPNQFLYNPEKGNLLVDIVISDQSSGMGALKFNPPSPYLSSRAWNSSTVYGNGNDIDTGAPPAALATRFQVTPVPEPSTMLLLGSGLFGLVGFGRRFRT